MQDDFLTRASAAPARRSGGRTLFTAALLVLVLGAVALGWLAWTGKLPFAEEPRTLLAKPAPAPSLVPIASPAPSPAALPAVTSLDQRLAMLETRFARLDLQADAAAGNAGRAEGLLIAFATRRAIERGAELGYLADQLKLRFSAAQPAAVEEVLSAARERQTLDGLVAKLDALAPALSTADPQASGWLRFRSEVRELFVIRSENAPRVTPEERIARAQLLLRGGQIDAAVAEVDKLPGRAAALGWIAAAQRHARALRALDLLETTAILEPHRLQDGEGDKVDQPSPVTPGR
ncbi:MAG: hypothetical protein ACREBO_00615 [Novosphingobium sp.]